MCVKGCAGLVTGNKGGSILGMTISLLQGRGFNGHRSDGGKGCIDSSKNRTEGGSEGHGGPGAFRTPLSRIGGGCLVTSPKSISILLPPAGLHAPKLKLGGVARRDNDVTLRAIRKGGGGLGQGAPCVAQTVPPEGETAAASGDSAAAGSTKDSSPLSCLLS